MLPILAELTEGALTVAGAQHDRTAAHHLKRMRDLATGTSKAAEVNDLIRQLREFDRAGLP